MVGRINRAIELLEQDQAIYYDGPHSGHVLTYQQGPADAGTSADYINVGMEHGAFDMTGLAEYMHGLVDGGPTRSGHQTPAVIVEAPLNGTNDANVRFNAWQFRQILARGVHGILLCQAKTAGAVRAFVEACRYPYHLGEVDPALPSPEARSQGATRPHAKDGLLGVGTRGRGSENTAAPVWSLSGDDYMDRGDPWPLNPRGEPRMCEAGKPRRDRQRGGDLCGAWAGIRGDGAGRPQPVPGVRHPAPRPLSPNHASRPGPRLRRMPAQRDRVSGGLPFSATSRRSWGKASG